MNYSEVISFGGTTFVTQANHYVQLSGGFMMVDTLFVLLISLRNFRRRNCEVVPQTARKCFRRPCYKEIFTLLLLETKTY